MHLTALPITAALRRAGIRGLSRATSVVTDHRHNRRLDSSGRRILFLRHHHPQGDYHWDFFRWLALEYPRLAARCELRRVGWQPSSVDGYALLVPLVQDPLRELFPQAYQQVWRVQAACDRAGIPVVNRIEWLSNSRKSTALRLIAGCGLRTPTVIRLDDRTGLSAAAGILGFPFLLRDDLGHGGTLRLVRASDELAGLQWNHRDQRIACEFIDTRDEYGFYRKYRYVLVGERGVPRHLIGSRDPVVRMSRRHENAVLREEEIAYLADDDPNHQRLDAARRALGFDVVAFDYSYDHDGHAVVWEPNPFPVIWGRRSESTRDRFVHQLYAVRRIYQHFARFYAAQAGLEALVDEPGPARLAA